MEIEQGIGARLLYCGPTVASANPEFCSTDVKNDLWQICFYKLHVGETTGVLQLDQFTPQTRFDSDGVLLTSHHELISKPIELGIDFDWLRVFNGLLIT